MLRKVFITTALSMVFASGCHHGRIVMTTDVNDSGDSIRTRYRYRVVSDDKNIYGTTRNQRFQTLHPEVFSDDGIPIVIDTQNTLNKKTGENTTLLPNLTFGLVPSVKTRHQHNRNSISVDGRQVGDFNTCSLDCAAYTMLPFPTPYLFFNGDIETCFGAGKTFSERCNNLSSQYSVGISLYEELLAYATAVRLKEAEESGAIADELVAKWRTSQSVADVGTLLNKILADERKRRGIEVKKQTDGEQLFEVVKCEVEEGGDFANRQNIILKGDKIPQGARFLTEGEKMVDGVLEVTFRTE